MESLAHLSGISAARWRELYRQAVAVGGGDADLEEERLAASDELVALALPGLVRLGALALIADAPACPPADCARVLGQRAAAVLRLLDRALVAHGRDTGYATDAWLGHALQQADVLAHELAQSVDVDGLPLGALVEDAAEAVADVVTALRRDRFGVPERLADAIGALLVLYAAATTTTP